MTPGELTRIDLDTWPRRTHFDHFIRRSPCLWSMTARVDVTALTERLRTSDRKTYIAQLWMLATIVNAHDEFRMTLDPEGQPAVWSVAHPLFTVFNPTTETFAGVWAEYAADFGAFHDRASLLLATHRTSAAYLPQDDIPANVFDVSSVPWTSFTGLELQIRDAWTHLTPIITIGKYEEAGGRVLMPLAVQGHHAAMDGFHVSRLLAEMEALAADPGWIF